MAGKSTYMRQVVLINLMAQIGSFVPCEEANIPIRDKVFTRIGASDNLLKGQSTFMVEMNEVSQILNTATNKSLIILDEVGRGTSTYDGISLAWAIVEYIKDKIKCNTLFATHYFELTELEDKYSNIKNYTVAIEEEDNEVIFLRKIIKGYTNQSYGIYVAEFANIPNEVIKRAKEILDKLENEDNNVSIEPIKISSTNNLEEEILNLNLMNMNPMEVFNYLYNLQNRLKK
jgi:DNA mismatch repair protein MutS